MELFVNTNKLEPEYVEFFGDTMLLREQADYELRYYPSAAEESIKNVERFLQKTREILGFYSPVNNIYNKTLQP